MQPNLYQIHSFTVNGDIIEATVILSKEHPVFEGHFPGNPILPGVCTLQITRELIQKAVGKNLMLSKAANIKYLGFVSPVSTPAVDFSILLKHEDGEIISCATKVTAGGNVSCSFKAEYKAILSS
jgi:3-hydroxyacyl-[acyl-carrier-protein] dehydratase